MLDSDPSTFAWSAQRALVVSPHPDDDVLGCGGTLAQAWAAGAALRVLYITDGSASHPGSQAFPPERLRDVRESEARAALGELGVPASQLHFLREPDGQLAREGPAALELAGRIAAHLGDFRPTMIFSPWVRDGHNDHVATSLAVRRAIARTASAATLYEYDVWPGDVGTGDSTTRPDEVERIRVDVRSFRERKTRAIRAHRSQLGALILDAREPFVLPVSLVQRGELEYERFVRIARSAELP